MVTFLWRALLLTNVANKISHRCWRLLKKDALALHMSMIVSYTKLQSIFGIPSIFHEGQRLISNTLLLSDMQSPGLALSVQRCTTVGWPVPILLLHPLIHTFYLQQDIYGSSLHQEMLKTALLLKAQEKIMSKYSTTT